LSGADTVEFNEKLVKDLKKHLDSNYYIANDTIGTIAAGSKNVFLIS